MTAREQASVCRPESSVCGERGVLRRDARLTRTRSCACSFFLSFTATPAGRVGVITPKTNQGTNNHISYYECKKLK